LIVEHSIDTSRLTANFADFINLDAKNITGDITKIQSVGGNVSTNGGSISWILAGSTHPQGHTPIAIVSLSGYSALIGGGSYTLSIGSASRSWSLENGSTVPTTLMVAMTGKTTSSVTATLYLQLFSYQSGDNFGGNPLNTTLYAAGVLIGAR